MGHGKLLFFPVSFSLFLILAVAAEALTGTVQLNSPANATWTRGTNDTVPFSFSYTDPDNATALCSLYINSPSAPMGSIQAFNDTVAAINSTGDFSEGANEWWVTCENGSYKTSERRTLYADRVAPTVSLVLPLDGVSLESGTISFIFRFTDDLSPSAPCTLFANHAERATNSNVPNSTQTAIAVFLGEGIYAWFMECADAAGNRGRSANSTLLVRAAWGVRITSPENRTYASLSIPLNFAVAGTAAWAAYSLDGMPNATLSGNTTMNTGREGSHMVEVYANDSLGRMKSDRAYFSVRLAHRIDFISPLRINYERDWVQANLTTDTDASSCELSLDGGSNLTMTGASARSWLFNLTSLSAGRHELYAWCRHPYGMISGNATFWAMSPDLDIGLITPQNRTYWNTTRMDIHLTLAADAVSCNLFVGSEGPFPMEDYSPRAWYYNISSIPSGIYDLRLSCTDPAGLSSSQSIEFTARSSECESNQSGICTGSQQCVSGRCIGIICDACRYPANSTCVPYECCSGSECMEEQACISNKCADVQCACGVIQNHTCIRYGCCSNFDCGNNQRCNTTTHECTGNTMTVIAPESVLAGEAFTIRVVDQDGDAIRNATVRVKYQSGSIDSFKTNDEGLASVVAAESGAAEIAVSMPGYDSVALSTNVVAGFNWVLAIAILIIIAAGGGGFAYWRQMPPVVLKKQIEGQNITLKVKNRSGGYLENVLITDTVPTGAFLSCGVAPRVETIGNEDHVSWFAALEPGEEISIDYQASGTSEGFTVRIGEEEHRSGYGLMSILREILKRIFPGKRNIVRQEFSQ